MKKLLLLIAAAAVLSSCIKGSDNEESPVQTGVNMYNAVMHQNGMSLDPFNVAIRLNALIEEGNGDFTKASAESKKAIFTDDVTITYDDALGQYTVHFPDSYANKTDIQRRGDIIIKTNGYASLSTPYVSWDITVTDYRVGSNTNITMGSYNITDNGGPWKIRVSKFVAIDPNNSLFQSDWTAIYEISTNITTLTLAELKKATFKLDVDVSKGKSMVFADRFNVMTTMPIVYSGACGFNILAPGGVMTIHADGNTTPKGTTGVRWLTASESCKVGTEITNNNATQVF